MAEYAPASRRPIANIFRATAQWATSVAVKRGISPDAISYLSIVAAALAAFCFLRAGEHPELLLFAPLICYLRLWLNMLDGMIALAANKASPRGEILNDLPDRISDILIFSGLALSGYVRAEFAWLGAIFAVLTAYVGLMGQAVAGKREFGGIMSKPWRMVVLHIGAWIAYLYPVRALDAACLIIIAGCIQTMLVRLRRTLALLRTRS